MKFNKVLATVLATVTALSSMAAVSAGAYEWIPTSSDGDGKYISGRGASSARGWKNSYRANVSFDSLTLKKNDRTTVHYLGIKENLSWKVQAGTKDGDTVYCNLLEDDRSKTWAPHRYTILVQSNVVDTNGKSSSSDPGTNKSGIGATSKVSVGWFKTKKSGSFSAKYTTIGFELVGYIDK